MWALLNDAATQITVVISLVILVSLAVLIYFIHGRMRSKGLSMEGGHAFDGILEGLNPTPFGLHLIMAGRSPFRHAPSQRPHCPQKATGSWACSILD